MIVGPYTLHPGVIWENEFSQPSVIQQVTRAILGDINIYSQPISKRELILSTKDGGNRTRGVFERELIDYLQTAEMDGSIVVVVYRGVTYNTVVKAGGLQVTSKRETESVDATDLLVGTISLYHV